MQALTKGLAQKNPSKLMFLRYELTLQNAQRVLMSLLEQPAKPWVPFDAPWALMLVGFLFFQGKNKDIFHTEFQQGESRTVFYRYTTVKSLMFFFFFE